MAQVFALLEMVVVGEEEGWREEDEKAEQWFKVRSRMLRVAKNSHDDTRPDLDIQSAPIFRPNLRVFISYRQYVSSEVRVLM